VHDNGPGIPPDQRAMIFDRFHQGSHHSDRPQGTGLGLPISRQIVEHFGGRIWLEPDAAQGACFKVWLPWAAGPREDGPLRGDKR
jgi:signal transduction histidine kinase